MYGPFTNEELVGRAIRGPARRGRARHQVRQRARRPNGELRGISGRPEYVRQACDGVAAAAGRRRTSTSTTSTASTRNVPIEETVGAMAELVQAGKVRYLGLSEAAPETDPPRARRRTRSPRCRPSTRCGARDAEDEILPTLPRAGHRLRRLQPARPRLPHRAASSAVDDLPADDFRRSVAALPGRELPAEPGPRRADRGDRAAKGRARAAQLALAWVLAQGDDIVPIPGTKRRKYLEENVAALDVALTAEDLARDRRGRAEGRRGRRALPRGGHGASAAEQHRNINRLVSPGTRGQRTREKLALLRSSSLGENVFLVVVPVGAVAPGLPGATVASGAVVVKYI